MASSGEGVNYIPEVIKLLNLAVIAGVVYVYARKGILQALKNRSAEITKKIVDAKIELEHMKLEVDRARKDIAEISKTKEKIMAEMREEGLKSYEIMVSEATQTADRILTDAKLAATNEVQSAIAKVKKHVVDQAVEQALVNMNSTSLADTKTSIHEKLVERFVANLTQSIQEKEGMTDGL